MAGSSDHQQIGLEDQIRNMILSPTSNYPTRQGEPPAFRLPPTQTYPAASVQHDASRKARPGPPGLHSTHPTGSSQLAAHRNGHTPDVMHHQPRAQTTAYAGSDRQYRTTQQHDRTPQSQFQRQPYQQRGYHQHPPVDPDAFNRGGPHGYAQQHSQQAQQQQRRQLYQSTSRAPHTYVQPRWQQLQAQYLDSIATREVPLVEMSQTERDEKEAFRKTLEIICQDVCGADPKRLPKVSIECFGSFQSGFASAGSDMDLVLVVQDASLSSACFSQFEDDLPRALEKRLLQIGYGARLLSRTRVPIIKVCQHPGSNLLSKLRQEREKWDSLDNDKKYPHLHKEEEEQAEEELKQTGQSGQTETTKPEVTDATTVDATPRVTVEEATGDAQVDLKLGIEDKAPVDTEKTVPQTDRPKREPWTRERKSGPLDFPKDGVGIQTDINFFNPLGIHNTQMLRCYSTCDPRVRPVILFVKAWAKRRQINSSYSGTLSSYGYVLMVLHYLTNIARPAVLPNLQMAWRPHERCTPQGADRVEVDEWVVDFWRRDDEIAAAARDGLMSQNRDSVGALLAGFFNYYSSQGGFPSFHWMGEVLSLRTEGGLLTKEAKGWVKAVTEQGEGKQVQHRYLFCIEDPFELGHNVARTVTHNGIVAIRDEFRRANRILRALGNGQLPSDGELFDPHVETAPMDASTTVQSTISMSQPQPQHPQHPYPQGQPRQARKPIQPKTLDVKDADLFPALGPAKPVPVPVAKTPFQPKKKKRQQNQDEAGEISGEKAKAFLAELQRKKDEQAAAKSST